jgi:16S rRNA U1498 N3-methylase RsmE
MHNLTYSNHTHTHTYLVLGDGRGAVLENHVHQSAQLGVRELIYGAAVRVYVCACVCV